MREPIHSGKVSEAALSKSIAVSVVGILLCMICLVGTTWAWYSLSVESGVSVTEGANFDFSVEITDNVDLDANGVYHFESGTHTVTLKKKGTAEKGFCKVEATKTGEETTTSYYIVDFTGKEFIEFTVKGSGTLKLIPMWGTPAEGYNPIPESGIELTLDTVAMTPPPQTEMQPDETGSPTDGEKGTPDETAEKQQQETPPAEEQQQQPVETPADPGTTEPEEKSEEVIGEQSQTKPETQVEPPVNTETTEPVTVPETQTEQTETSKTTTQE